MESEDGQDLDAVARLAQEGNEEAIEMLATACGAWLFPWFVQGLPPGADAEQAALDVIQEAFEHLDRFDPRKSSFRTWITTIAFRRRADFYRRQERRFREEPTATELKHRESYHAESWLTREQIAKMAGHIATLKLDDVELLRLFFDEKLSDSQVAELLGIKPDSARQRKRRLVTRLHEKLQKLTSAS